MLMVLTRIEYWYSIKCKQCGKKSKFSNYIPLNDNAVKERDFSYTCQKCGFFNSVKGEIGLGGSGKHPTHTPYHD